MISRSSIRRERSYFWKSSLDACLTDVCVSTLADDMKLARLIAQRSSELGK